MYVYVCMYILIYMFINLPFKIHIWRWGLQFLIQGPIGQRCRKVGEHKIVGGWKKGRIEKILISLIFVWLGVEKQKDGKSEFV